MNLFIVTIVEIHMLIVDVCACLGQTGVQNVLAKEIWYYISFNL